jgi:hypothetical protein
VYRDAYIGSSPCSSGIQSFISCASNNSAHDTPAFPALSVTCCCHACCN